MSDALLPLLFVVPMVVAATTVLVRHELIQRFLLLAVPVWSVTCGVYLLALHQSTPAIAHAIGSFVPGVAIVLASDSLSALMLTATGTVTFFASVFLIITGEDRYRFAVPLTILVSAGVNGALVTADLFNLFVFVEVMLLPSYALVALAGTWRRLGIGRMFILVNLVASTLLLLGVGLIYAATGTVTLASLAGAGSDPQASLAAGVIFFALLVKGAAVPVHGWLVRAYPATSAPVMALFSGLHTKIGLYACYRLYAVIWEGQPSWWPILLVVVIATILVGAVSTFGERRIRGALAFQMITGVGQILVGLVVFTQLSVTAGLFYMVHHMITMGALVLASGAIEDTYGSGRFERLGGLMRRDPVIAATMALGFFSLVGLPPTSGLWGKVGLLGGAAQPGGGVSWSLVGAIVLGSVLSLLALQNVWREVFWGPPLREYLPDDPASARGRRTELTDETKIRWRTAWPSVVLMSGSVALFVLAGVVYPFFSEAAAGLVDTSAYVKAVLG